MRGTHIRGRHRQRVGGIIPAYAGNTQPSRYFFPVTTDHPRVCGEHLEPFGRHHMHQGSSPRMRGTHSTCHLTSQYTGIIPAYAGNTAERDCRRRPDQDHPRVCGEHVPNVTLPNCKAGSSPRMRGTHDESFDAWLKEGIIPAYAGNTWPGQSIKQVSRDHPRVCGEHIGCSL